MGDFEFGIEVTNRIIEELKEAEKYIHIAIFQLHNEKIFQILYKKLEEGVKVVVLTLPYDSINEEIQDVVIARFEKLKERGAILSFCKWNVGDPGRTSTAVGRWYSFHVKFIVTDQAAIVLSANFTEENEIDAILVFKNDEEKIKEFNKKFDELLELFVSKKGQFEGTIRGKIINENPTENLEVFELPGVIETETHKNHWILHYPEILCPQNINIEDNLYLVPFDGRGRDLYENLISEAKDFVLLSTESFTDAVFARFLMKKKLEDIEILILSGTTSMDFPEKIQKMFRELLACDIKIKTPVEKLHAKMIVTDKRLVISSININKMNLGFKKTVNSIRFWRENTESLLVCSDRNSIKDAKNQFLQVFKKSEDVEKALTKKLCKDIGQFFNHTFGLHTSSEVKDLFAKLVLKKEVDVKRLTIKIGKIADKLMKHLDKKTIQKEHFLMGLILYYLTEKKLEFDQIREKLMVIEPQVKPEVYIDLLMKRNFIEKENDYYKIKLETLLL